MSYESRLSAVLLSRGSQWSPLPSMPPYLLADPLNPWPADAEARIVFYNTAGSVLATVAGIVTAEAISFTAAAAVIDAVPAGAKFEVILDLADTNSVQIRYGEVMRREAQFLTAPAATSQFAALRYADSFPTLGLSSSWVTLAGSPKVWDNSGYSLPNAVGGPNIVGLVNTSNSSQAALRWFAPLNGDTVKVNFNLLGRQANPSFSASRARVIICSDIRMTSYLGVQFEENTHTVRWILGQSPLAVSYPGGTTANTVSTSPDNYTLTYSLADNTARLYKGSSTSPLTSFTDSSHAVPHGMGYRYAGLAFESGDNTDGLQVSYWSAKDDA